MIPDDLVDRIREAADIVQIIGEHVELKRTGTSYRGPCPFHQGTHRNFSVSPDKSIFYCFVCHESGDVFSFLQKRLGMTWPSAVRAVAERTGIAVPDETQRRPGPDPREPLWEVNGVAAEYFRRILWSDPLGSPARDYLYSRAITREVAERFGLGFAPREIGLMRAYLQTLGFGDDRQIEAGLLVRADEGAEPRPRFRGRVIFPISDTGGRVVGFGGRLIAAGEPKYLNSGETEIFQKRRLLYGLSWAKQAMRREDRVLVVEGYFDAVRLMAHAVDSVVAPLGTALTEEQATTLLRYTKNVFLLYDSDRAGLKATFEAGDRLLNLGARVQVVTFPEGEDPDSFVAKHGVEGLTTQVAAAIDIFERKVQLLERAGSFTDLRRKRRAIDKLLPTIRATADPVMRELYLARASEASGVSQALLAREAGGAKGGVRGGRGDAPASPPGREEGSGAPPLRSAARGPDRRGRGAGGAERGHAGGPRWGSRDPHTKVVAESAERELIRIMLQAPAQLELLAERVGLDDFLTPVYRELYAALLAQGGRTLRAGDGILAAMSGTLGERAAAIAEELLSETGAVGDLEATSADSVKQLNARRMQERVTELDELIPLALGSEKDDLIREKSSLVRTMSAEGGRGWKTLGSSTR
ncbi:MAG: hypothetical protein NVS9B3_04580 [Gemmatimonadaceae bacterium]